MLVRVGFRTSSNKSNHMSLGVAVMMANVEAANAQKFSLLSRDVCIYGLARSSECYELCIVMLCPLQEHAVISIINALAEPLFMLNFILQKCDLLPSELDMSFRLLFCKRLFIPQDSSPALT